MKVIITLFTVFSILAFDSHAQDRNPYKSIGKKGKVITLTQGKYEESFDDDSIQQIGTALVNIHTMQVVKFELTKEEQRIIDETAVSRFLSVDPIASSYPELTPYQFASNTPIQAIDLDGLEKYIVTNYLNKNRFIYQTMITTLTDKDANQLVNMHLRTANRVLDQRDVIVRNVSPNGKTTYQSKDVLNDREGRVINKGHIGEPIPKTQTASVGIGRGFGDLDNGETALSAKDNYPTDQYKLKDHTMDYHPVSLNNKMDLGGGVYLGTTDMLGNIKNGTLVTDKSISDITGKIDALKQSISEDGNISSININVNGILGPAIQSSADPQFAAYQRGLQNIGDQIKQRLGGSGVKNITINANAQLGQQSGINANVQLTRKPQN